MTEIHLVTGHSGAPHVTAADAASLNVGIFDNGRYVLNVGKKLKCTVTTNNNIRIEDGDILMQGRHIRVATGEAVNLFIENGEQNKKRNDLIVCRYTRAADGKEKAEIAVIKGNSAEGAAEMPTYTDGNISAGDELAEMPLYRVPIDGITVGKPIPLFTVLKTGLEREKETRELVNSALPKSGGTITGTLTQQGMFKLGTANYGTELPAPGNIGRVFFKKV